MPMMQPGMGMQPGMVNPMGMQPGMMNPMAGMMNPMAGVGNPMAGLNQPAFGGMAGSGPSMAAGPMFSMDDQQRSGNFAGPGAPPGGHKEGSFNIVGDSHVKQQQAKQE